jgi:hypothetical protein
MKVGTVANPQQIAAMANVIDRYCKHVGIARESPEEQQVAALVLALHEAGVRSENDLLRALIVPNNRMPSDKNKAAA